MASANPLEHFLAAVATVKATGAGTRETSYYPALSNLLDAVGDTLKPKVRCVTQLKNLGAGNPDGGFFTADQFDRKTGVPKQPGSPARGVLEVKSPAEAVSVTTASAQVAKYWDRYQLVLVTNLRDWLLLGEREGRRVELERYTLADDEAAFWELAARPRLAAQTHGSAFADFLTRVLRHNAPLTEPRDLAWLLASYPREARYRIERADPKALTQLDALKSSLEKSIGAAFDSTKGEHFFRSTLVQTLFYGIFAAWVLRHEENKLDPFDWKTAAHDLHVPMISALFEQLSQPSKLNALNLTQVLDWAGDALTRVDKAAFFSKFEAARSVQYFYEPFLEAFDPQLRKELGVWYTPEEIVRYQVARVDEALRCELHLADGLADSNVVVLDPCCGTGAYLVEVLRVIGEKLARQGADAVAAHELKRAAMARLFGFEILPAPFVIAHLQLGLLLRHRGAALSHAERAGVYLTNALTGWEPRKDPKASLPFPEFAQERDAADAVKQTQKILVILGNPPYNAFSGVAVDEERDLVATYKQGLIKQWGIKKFNLDDPYVRFFRLAERRIAEEGGRGVVSFISNYSWTSEPSFVVMREHLVKSFDEFWVENMHGNRNISEYAPDGRTSETIFAQQRFSPGIRQGVVVSTWIKRGTPDGNTSAQVFYRDDLNEAKADERRAALLASLDDPQRDSHYVAANPSASNRYSFRPDVVAAEYASWPKLPELSRTVPITGYKENRGFSLMHATREVIAERMRKYFDRSISWQALELLNTGLTKNAARFDAKLARDKCLAEESFNDSRIQRYLLRPFESRWAYYCAIRPLWNEPRPALYQHHHGNNAYLISRPGGVADPEGFPILFTNSLADFDAIRGHTYNFPMVLHGEQPTELSQSGLFAHASAPPKQANLSPAARAYLAHLGLPDPDSDRDTAELIWLHALAIGYSTAYLAEHADGIRQNWPRIPLPATRAALQASAQLGRDIAALLDTETPVPGVTGGAIRAELQTVAVISRVGGGALQPDEFKLTAGWGHAGKEGVTMPGRGKLEPRAADAGELDPHLRDDAASAQTLDIYLNSNAYWKNVPPPVWEFTIGGYQVIKKWLSYREFDLLGRALTLDEIKEVSAMARRLAALVLLQPALDDNYRAVAADAYAWPA